MSFETGVATSYDNFFTLLRAFAVAEASFTDEGTVDIGGDLVHTLSKGGLYWNFQVGGVDATGPDTYYAKCRMTYSQPTVTYNNSTPTGQPEFTRFGTYSNLGPFIGYTFYTEGTAVHAVLEVYPNIFAHLSFGNITKVGTWVGGEYITASSATRATGGANNFVYDNANQMQHLFPPSLGAEEESFVRYVQTGSNEDDFAPAGAISNINLQKAIFSNGIKLTTLKEGIYESLIEDGPNAFNSRTVLLPIYVLLRNRNADFSPSLYFHSGSVPGVRICNITELVAHDIVDTDWEVYPAFQKGGDEALAPDSTVNGLAYQRIA